MTASAWRGLGFNLSDGYRPKIRKAPNPHAETPTSNIAHSEGLSSQTGRHSSVCHSLQKAKHSSGSIRAYVCQLTTITY
jgi:hypothetical protein